MDVRGNGHYGRPLDMPLMLQGVINVILSFGYIQPVQVVSGASFTVGPAADHQDVKGHNLYMKALIPRPLLLHLTLTFCS